MDDSDNQNKLNELKKNYLKTLKETINSTPLYEYYQYLSNSIDANERYKQDKKKFDKLKTYDKQYEHQNKQFKTNWNLDYCEYCKLDYWPSNCQVYMLPKCRLTHKNAKLYMKYKLFNYKPKYKSYKDRLIKKILNKGIRLVYKCKRCLSKNIILNETKRECSFKLIKLKNANSDKNLKEKAKMSKIIHSTSLNSLNNQQNNNNNNNRKNLLTGKKKFQSLQVKLKQNELELNLNKTKQKSLTDFLMQLT